MSESTKVKWLIITVWICLALILAIMIDMESTNRDVRDCKFIGKNTFSCEFRLHQAGITAIVSLECTLNDGEVNCLIERVVMDE